MVSETLHKKSTINPLNRNKQSNQNNLRKFFNRFPHAKAPPMIPHPIDITKIKDISKCPVMSTSTSTVNFTSSISPTQRQIDLVRTSWERVSEIRQPGDDRNISSSHAFGLAFYDALFEQDGETKQLFDNVFQQARALTGMISYIARAPGVTTSKTDSPPCTPTTIRDINAAKKNRTSTDSQQEYDEGDPEWLACQMMELGARHYFYGAKPHHFNLVGPAFATALKKRLGDEYTEEIGEAWVKANSYAAYNMKIGFESQQAWEEGTQYSSKKNKAACIIQ